MRIIFLDIDGPMIPDQIAMLPREERFPLKPLTRFPCYSAFSPYSRNMIMGISRGLNAKIVTNSTHNTRGPEHIKALFNVNGMPPDEFLHPTIMTTYRDRTIVQKGTRRDEAVGIWMMEHGETVDGIVIIDDSLVEDYNQPLRERFGVEASSLYGLAPYQADDIRQILTKRKNTGWTDQDWDIFCGSSLNDFDNVL